MNVRELLGRDRFAKLLGIELLDVSEGTATSKMEIRDEHLNGVDIAQGGAIFTLADFTLAAAANSHGTIAVVIYASINFIKAASQGILFAKAIEISRTSKIATYIVNITNTEGVLIAEYHGTAYRRGESS